MKNKKPEIYICMYVLKHAIEATHRYIDRQTDRYVPQCVWFNNQSMAITNYRWNAKMLLPDIEIEFRK